MAAILYPSDGTCSINTNRGGGVCRAQGKICICINRTGGVGVMAAFKQGSNMTSTNPSGYEYLLEKTTINASNSLAEGFYCRENNYGSGPRTDKHCTGTLKRKDWYGSWFLMDK